MSYQAKNLVKGSITSAMTAVQTTIPLVTGQGTRFPNTTGGQYELVIWDSSYPSASDAFNASKAEVVLVTSHDASSDTIATITRAQGGTSAIAHSAGANVELVFSKTMFDHLHQLEAVAFQSAPNDALGAAAAGANPTPYSSLQVVAAPVWLLSQTISKVCFNVSNNSFAHVGGDGIPYIAVGLYDSSGARLIDGTWRDVELAGNKSVTLGASVTIKTGMYYLAWVGRFTASGALVTRSYENTTRVPFMNFDGFKIGIAANAATAPTAEGSAAMPSTLGAISDPSSAVTIPVVLFT